jgi:hypothetical protein
MLKAAASDKQEPQHKQYKENWSQNREDGQQIGFP